MKYYKFIIITFTLIASFGCRASVHTQLLPEIRYTLTPQLSLDTPVLQVELAFRGNSAGETKLELPNEWAGETNLYKGLNNFFALSHDTFISPTQEPHILLLRYRPNTMVRLRYDIQQETSGEPKAADGNPYRPVIQTKYFHVIGWSGLAFPQYKDGSDTRIRAIIGWGHLPSGCNVASSFGKSGTTQKIDLAIHDLQASIFVGGDFRLIERKVRGRSLVVALRGAPPFSDKDFANSLPRIVGFERDFWPDNNFPYFLVTFLPLQADSKGTSMGGTSLTTSFASFGSPEFTLPDYQHTLAHELFHTWNPQKIGLPVEPEALLYWFMEGFTDYYAEMILLRTGLVTPEQFVEAYNQLLRDYTFSPKQHAPNDEIKDGFWKDYALQKLPYQRGMLVAAVWNARIKEESHGRYSLDDVMRDLFNASRTSHPPNGLPLTKERIATAINRYIPTALDDIASYIEQGKVIDATGILGPCAIVENRETAVYERGYDAEATAESGIITGLKLDSAAARAGLRDGQIVVKRLSGRKGDSTIPSRLLVSDGREEKEISYLPEGAEKFVMQQFVSNLSTPVNRKACLEWLNAEKSTSH